MTVAELQARTLARLDDSGVYYPANEVLWAIEEGQRVFALLTLCLERTASLTLAGGTVFYRMLTQYTDWLLPLRVRVGGLYGGKVAPARLADLDARSLTWQAEEGTPARYAHLGFDFLALHPHPAGAGTSLDVTYARCPAAMNANSTLEIPEEYHADLIDYAIPALRAKEGGQEFQSSLKYLERFLEGAQKMGDYVRARNVAAGYDRGPFELKAFDRSKLAAAMKGKGQHGG